MTKRIVYGVFAAVLGMTFWMLWDHAPRDHVPFDFLDARSLLGLLAWFCAGLSADFGATALRGVRITIKADGDAA